MLLPFFIFFDYPLYMPLIKKKLIELKVFDIANSTDYSYFKRDFFFFKPQTLFGSYVLTSHRALFVLTISQGSISSLVKSAARKERNPFALNT